MLHLSGCTRLYLVPPLTSQPSFPHPLQTRNTFLQAAQLWGRYLLHICVPSKLHFILKTSKTHGCFDSCLASVSKVHHSLLALYTASMERWQIFSQTKYIVSAFPEAYDFFYTKIQLTLSLWRLAPDVCNAS